MVDQSEFLPFHAINEFMRPDFKLTVIRETLSAQSILPDRLSAELNRQVKKTVSVPGFRNSDKAPALMKVLPVSKAFEKQPDLVSALLSCWAETQAELRERTYHLLETRHWPLFTESAEFDLKSISMDILQNWPVLPLNVDRTKLPGFFTHWFKGEEFDVLYNNFSAVFPDAEISMDKVSLMVVWLSMRLPYQVDAVLENTEMAQK